MTVPEPLSHLFAALASVAEPWRDLYSNSTVVSTGVLFAHIAALVIGGGLALTMDGATLRASRAGVDAAARGRQLGDLALAHRTVVASLGVVAASGALLFLADVEQFAGSWVFWSKMALVAALLANGYTMTRTERTLAAGIEGAGTRWARLSAHARVSAALWLATLLAGTILSNV